MSVEYTVDTRKLEPPEIRILQKLEPAFQMHYTFRN